MHRACLLPSSVCALLLSSLVAWFPSGGEDIRNREATRFLPFHYRRFSLVFHRSPPSGAVWWWDGNAIETSSRRRPCSCAEGERREIASFDTGISMQRGIDTYLGPISGTDQRRTLLGRSFEISCEKNRYANVESMLMAFGTFSTLHFYCYSSVQGFDWLFSAGLKSRGRCNFRNIYIESFHISISSGFL